MRKLLIIMILFGIIGCTKELNISDFSEDFDSYKSELRIEAILNATDFMNSVVRVDKTILVTDTTLFNGIDDNGNWVSYSDLNGNGRWDNNEPLNDDIGGDDGGKGNGKPDKGEPHVDDYFEILPQIHDSTMASVRLIDRSNGDLVAEFEWATKAGIIEDYVRTLEDDPEKIEIYSYGGYKPKSQYNETKILSGREYEFQITTATNNVISGSTVPFSAAEIVMDDTIWDADTLIINSDSDNSIDFLADGSVSLGSFTFREAITPDSFLYSFNPIFPPDDYDQSGRSIFVLPKSIIPIGLSQLTVSIFDNIYSQYFISNLELRDASLSNLRDQDGKVILGVVGSQAVTTIYIKNTL